MSKIVIPEDSEIYSICQRLAEDAKIVILTGLPGVGKSLYVQQMTAMAQAAGRQVHLLQWDVTRSAFETDAILAKYPEIDGFTHAMIRKAVGLWTRDAILRWANDYQSDEHVLIGESTLVGERLMQLAKPLQDDAEVLLSSQQTQFLLPVPTKNVRTMIEAKRAESITNPRHQHETKDAPPNVLQALWHEIYGVGAELGFCEAHSEPIYDDAVYRQTYEYLLQYRHYHTLSVADVLPASESVYELGTIASHLKATPDEVAYIMTMLETQSTVDEVEADVERWYEF
ncbi:MAG: AAA family ATPase [Chloroflexota bacterium]